MAHTLTEVAVGTIAMHSKAIKHTVEGDTPSLCNCSNLRRAARRVSRFYDECLASSGIKATQFTILGVLKHRGPKTMLKLAEMLTMDRATIGHNLRPLERDGLVSIEIADFDRRARVVKITQMGLDAIALARPAWDRAQTEFEQAFGVDEARAMRAMMQSIVATDFEVRSAGD